MEKENIKKDLETSAKEVKEEMVTIFVNFVTGGVEKAIDGISYANKSWVEKLGMMFGLKDIIVNCNGSRDTKIRFNAFLNNVVEQVLEEVRFNYMDDEEDER